MRFTPVSKRDNRKKGMSLSIGVDGRMYLSAELKANLGHTDKENYFLFFDHSEGKIGLAKDCKVDHVEPFTFNRIGEGKVTSFIEDCEIHIPGQPLSYLFEGKEDGIYSFHPKGRKKTSFEQEKNGNLVKI